jgi:hypothetical protein
MYRGKWIFLGLSASLFMLLGNSLHANPLYSQPTNYFGGYYSEDDSSTAGFGNYVTTFDDFTLSSAADISSVSWVGTILNGVTPTAFTISIWSSTTSSCPGGEPSCPNLSAPIYSTTVAGNAGQSYLQNDFFNYPAYSYSDPINFNASAGTEYWISIAAVVPSTNDWVWESGTGGDGFSYQNLFGEISAIQVDEAFSFYSVPEPASMVLAAGGLGLLALIKRLK